ncbi:hypothetical protein SAY86_012116 [Trapa natans]|uniref:Myosin-2 n=1 Tax=Trapa natans TaxID=22666 RepID=A0AAN7M9G5_TRANT|nr:hypothetical protein SAY86_012116 [Trapa natans]
MLSSASPMSVTRSSLEEMLDMLRRQDEAEKPEDLPPALPARPLSKARLPSPRQLSLPVNFEVDNANDNNPMNTNSQPVSASGCEVIPEDSTGKDKESSNSRRNFGGKKMEEDLNLDSPYVIGIEERKEVIKSLASTVESSGFTPCLTSRIREREWEDNIGYFIKKKLSVWCHLVSGEWVSGTILSTKGEEARVLLSNGNTKEVPTGELLPANPDILEGVEDLLQLSYLNDPSILHNLKCRYSHDMIYSMAGPLLIAINPYKDVKTLGQDITPSFRLKVTGRSHICAVANTSYNEMMRDDVNQSIIISGESGSGKTETAKIAMQCLVASGGGNTAGIEDRILQTSCILEAFGNSKTSKNDNSSRFGKFIEILFSTSGKICGAKVQTFLLEKSRIVQLAKGERSYHIFYQLCAGATPSLKETLNLKLGHEYNYLKESGCLIINGVDDEKRFHLLLDALDVVGIRHQDQEGLFAMVAAILWLGNIRFQVIDGENHVDVVADEALTTAASLMGCKAEDLILALSTRKISVGKDSISKKLTAQQASNTRDALAQFIYSSLFDWLVDQINNSLDVGQQFTGRSINILDIYGFESLKNNSFEQFCINYASERLQQHFYRHLFKLEQEDYEMDGIDWTRVDFKDNQKCINLIEKKPLGILSLLDEESSMPKATDMTFAHKLKQQLDTHPCFKGEKDGAFRLYHYAGEVLYDTNGFLDKNRDPVFADLINFLSSCCCQLPQLFASRILSKSPKAGSPLYLSGSNDFQNRSIAANLKHQLFLLLHHIETTRPHFILCIKPNNKQLPGLFEKDLVLQQLRCCEVQEVVRISRLGYPTRMPHQEFAERYGFLLSDANMAKDPLSKSVAILRQFNILPEMYRVGYTKLYLRNGQVASLEDERKRFLQGIIRVQKFLRGCKVRNHFHEFKNGVTALQSFVRGEIARKKFEDLKKMGRISAPGNSMKAPLEEIVYIQSVIRGWMARKQLDNSFKLKKLCSEKPEIKSSNRMSGLMDIAKEPAQVLPTPLIELQSRILKAEAAIEHKHEENAELTEKLREFQTKWSDYEARMKSMEEVWQKQMAALQMSLAAARTNAIPEDYNAITPRRFNATTSPRDYDSEDATSMGSRTPIAIGSTPMKFSASIPHRRAARDNTNGTLSTVNDLIKEFELRKQTFDEDARSLGQDGHRPSEISPQSFNPDEELRKLKASFDSWKKDYKVRLREARVKLHKLGYSESDRRRKWWGKMR